MNKAIIFALYCIVGLLCTITVLYVFFPKTSNDFVPIAPKVLPETMYPDAHYILPTMRESGTGIRLNIEVFEFSPKTTPDRKCVLARTTTYSSITCYPSR